MSLAPLMPKATAVWLIDNTRLTFTQIAEYCHLHELEVKGIADGDVAQGIKGLDPVASGQLQREEIEKGEADQNYRMKLSQPKAGVPVMKPRRGPRYTPVSRRQDRPDAIAWILRYHPELPDSQIIKLVGTTKPTIQAIRERTHWNSPNIKPVDPVTLGLCTQLDLDLAVQKAARKLSPDAPVRSEPVRTLLPASQTTAAAPKPERDAPPAEKQDYDADTVFAKLKGLKLEPEASDGGKD